MVRVTVTVKSRDREVDCASIYFHCNVLSGLASSLDGANRKEKLFVENSFCSTIKCHSIKCKSIHP